MRVVAVVSAWAALTLFGLATPAAAALSPDRVPTFHLRARVTSAAGQPPGGRTFTFHVAKASAKATGDAWSDWLTFDRTAAEENLKGYPAIYLKGYPVVTALTVDGVADPTAVEAELKLDETGEVVPLAGDLFGPRLSLLVWREAFGGKPHAATAAQYNRWYWAALKGVEVPPDKRPKRFPITDRFIGTDDDRTNWREGIENLTKAGFSAIMLPPSKPVREIARDLGVTKTAWAVYSPPGYAFDAAPPGKEPPEGPDEWAKKQAKAYTDAGWDVKDVAAFAMSDEPGWYYPATLKLADDPAVLARFREYLKAQGLKPADLGAESWDAVRPVGRTAAKDLPSKRLFYWSMRFFPHDSARYFADCTRAMEAAFYPGLPLTTNWNFFAGRFYVPGPVANNADKTSPDAAMGCHDPFEFARMRGCTMLWTEDWFPDRQAYQWSFYCARLRSAAEKGGVQFGGYVVPRASGDGPDGLLKKTMCLVGSGGKAVKYYVFGPEYAFPGNCYSDRPGDHLRQIAEANAMIGAAEDLLWEGKRPKPQVAILSPRSSQAWDLKDMPVAKGIEDATNTNLTGRTMDYMAEVYGLYLALQAESVAVEFVDEDDLTADGLKPYKLIYLTEPNVPEEGQRGLVEWVKAGGRLFTASGAAARDRYDEPCTILSDAAGTTEVPRDRVLVADLPGLKESGRDNAGRSAIVAYGPRGTLKDPPDPSKPMPRFTDGAPLALYRRLGAGEVMHHTFMPGLSYARAAGRTWDGLPKADGPGLLRDRITCVPLAGVGTGEQPAAAWVSGGRVGPAEASMLLSDKGAAVTVLNWSTQPGTVELKVRVPFTVRSVEAVRAGPLPFDGGQPLKLSLPLKAVDVIMIRP